MSVAKKEYKRITTKTLVEMKKKVGVSKSKHSYFAPPPKAVKS
jgi:hypothetical protein